MYWYIVLGIIITVLAVLAAIVLLRAAFIKAALPKEKQDSHHNAEAEEKLSRAIRFETVSTVGNVHTDWKAFKAFNAFLKEAFPLLAQEEWTPVAEHSLIIRVKGEGQGDPCAFLAHIDVVPAGDPSLWDHAPFSGDMDEKYIHGRGAMDMKGHMICALQAMEELLRQGFRPQRDIYFCLGHDEEVVPEKGGATAMVELLHEQGIRFEFVVDEGGTVADVSHALGNTACAALLCVAEKGYLDVELSVEGTGGHSSRPPKETPLSILAKAIVRLNNRPGKLRLTPVMKAYYQGIAPYASFGKRIFLANFWLLKGLFLRLEARDPAKAAMLRTTFVPTIAKGSTQANVIPVSASAVCNLRLLQGERSEETLKRLKKIIGDERVSLRVLRCCEASPISPMDSLGYRLLQEALAEVYPQALCLPYVMSGGTDSRHYVPICKNILKISPMFIERNSGMHGPNERILKSSLAEGTAVFRYIMQRC